jgi:hypothetical protein
LLGSKLPPLAAITATDGSVALTAKQLEALENARNFYPETWKITVPAGDSVTVEDTIANINRMFGFGYSLPAIGYRASPLRIPSKISSMRASRACLQH